jgi:Chitobiase/beta-hexosaminidase C-terminal domain
MNQDSPARRSILQRAVQAVTGTSGEGPGAKRLFVLSLAVVAICLSGYAPKRAWRTVSGGWWTAQSVHAQGGSNAPTFVTFETKDAGQMMAQGTVGTSVNATGVVAGIYLTMPNVAHGFVRAADGTITEFDAPDAGTGLNQGTFPTSINAGGDIAGFYSNTNVAYRGFVRSGANGTITEFDFPGAPTTTGHRGTSPTSINANGDIVGFYRGIDDVSHGFLRTASNGNFVSFDVPAAGTSATEGTLPFSVNLSGMIAGSYRDSSGVQHGFIGPASGPFTTFDAPGAAGSSSGITKKVLCCGGTFALNIDAAGDVAGFYTDANAMGHGFLLAAASGKFTAPIDAPGASTTSFFPGTLVAAINSSGVLVGDFEDNSGAAHGFVRAADGTITAPLSAPNASTAGLGQFPGGTASVSISDSGAVTGGYFDSGFVVHGFVLTPAAVAGPTFNPTGGTFSSAQMVTLADTRAGASIFYTTDGSTPTSPPTGTTLLFNGPINVASTETINAIAADPASWFSNSAVASAAYTINNGPPPPTPDFTVSVNPTMLTIPAGQSGKATFTVTPENGFNSQVSFACSGLPSEANCSFSPSTVTPNGGSASTTLTVATMAASGAMRVPELPSSPRTGYALLLLALIAVPAIAGRQKRAARGWQLLSLLMLLIAASGITSCGGGSNGAANPGTPAGTTTATVTASTSADGGIKHPVTLTITITN